MAPIDAEAHAAIERAEIDVAGPSAAMAEDNVSSARPVRSRHRRTDDHVVVTVAVDVPGRCQRVTGLALVGGAGDVEAIGAGERAAIDLLSPTAGMAEQHIAGAGAADFADPEWSPEHEIGK